MAGSNVCHPVCCLVKCVKSTEILWRPASEKKYIPNMEPEPQAQPERKNEISRAPWPPAAEKLVEPIHIHHYQLIKHTSGHLVNTGTVQAAAEKGRFVHHDRTLALMRCMERSASPRRCRAERVGALVHETLQTGSVQQPV